ncbi:hypothetical protein [Salininema proteolyticum]|uniref:Lipoprotein n=1 Tax=Salininema proteolyticum TaxID=1607685 RepID=A0ABV8TTW6_9ACTN
MIALAGLAAAGCGADRPGTAGDAGDPADYGPHDEKVIAAWEEQRSDLLDDGLRLMDSPYRFDGDRGGGTVEYIVDIDFPRQHGDTTVAGQSLEEDFPALGAEDSLERFVFGVNSPDPCPDEGEEATSTEEEGEEGVASAVADCQTVTITEIAAETDVRWTNDGPAEVPVWTFTAEDAAKGFTALAVDLPEPDEAPTLEVGGGEPPEGSVPATYIAEAGDKGLSVAYGVSSCDGDVVPSVTETGEIVIVYGTAESEEDVCDMMMRYEEVALPLESPLDGRMVVDGWSGRVLRAGSLY